MSIQEQIITINPSVAPALFRLLMRDADVSYLRDDDGIIGFEILPDSVPISGFALIGMRKRTILAYRSEDARPRLILFPSMEKLFNHAYELLGLSAKKVWIQDDQFQGVVKETGLIADLVKDLTPPEKVVSLPDNLTEQMIRIMIAEHSDQEEQDNAPAQASPKQFQPSKEQLSKMQPPNEPFSNEPFSNVQPPKQPVANPYFTSSEWSQHKASDEPWSQPHKVSADPLLDAFKQQSFTDEHQMIDTVVTQFGVNRNLLLTLLNALLAKTQGMPSQQRVKQFHLLVIRLLTEKREVRDV